MSNFGKSADESRHLFVLELWSSTVAPIIFRFVTKSVTPPSKEKLCVVVILSFSYLNWREVILRLEDLINTHNEWFWLR